MFNWKEKVILLTGASSGIGAGIALAVARQGATLGLVARRKEMLDDLVAQCEEVGGTAIAFPIDVTDDAGLIAAADEMRERFGRIDILVANAGVGGNDAETRAYTPQAVRRLVEINLLGAANAVYAVVGDMILRRSGHLVAVSSLAGYRGLPQSAAYSASKAGMSAFFESVRIDVQRSGVDVTIIHPGFIRTPLTSSRAARMPFLMELEDAIPYFLRAIERKKRFAAFPWPLATLVRGGRLMPGWLYDRIAGRARFRE